MRGIVILLSVLVGLMCACPLNASDYISLQPYVREVSLNGLTAPRTWADVPGTTPDGCTLDADGAIWFADARGRQVVRVAEGGDVLAHLPTPDPTFACMLGGTDGRTLFVLTAAGAHPDVVAGRGTGRLLARRVDVGRAAGSRP